MAILPVDSLESGVSAARRLSRRQVRRRVRIGQRWTDERGATWTVANVHRKDELVHLRGRVAGIPVPVSLFPTFADLARHYELVEDGHGS